MNVEDDSSEMLFSLNSSTFVICTARKRAIDDFQTKKQSTTITDLLTSIKHHLVEFLKTTLDVVDSAAKHACRCACRCACCSSQFSHMCHSTLRSGVVGDDHDNSVWIMYTRKIENFMATCKQTLFDYFLERYGLTTTLVDYTTDTTAATNNNTDKKNILHNSLMFYSLFTNADEKLNDKRIDFQTRRRLYNDLVFATKHYHKFPVWICKTLAVYQSKENNSFFEYPKHPIRDRIRDRMGISQVCDIEDRSRLRSRVSQVCETEHIIFAIVANMYEIVENVYVLQEDLKTNNTEDKIGLRVYFKIKLAFLKIVDFVLKECQNGIVFWQTLQMCNRNIPMLLSDFRQYAKFSYSYQQLTCVIYSICHLQHHPHGTTFEQICRRLNMSHFLKTHVYEIIVQIQQSPLIQQHHALSSMHDNHCDDNLDYMFENKHKMFSICFYNHTVYSVSTKKHRYMPNTVLEVLAALDVLPWCPFHLLSNDLSTIQMQFLEKWLEKCPRHICNANIQLTNEEQRKSISWLCQRENTNTYPHITLWLLYRSSSWFFQVDFERNMFMMEYFVFLQRYSIMDIFVFHRYLHVKTIERFFAWHQLYGIWCEYQMIKNEIVNILREKEEEIHTNENKDSKQIQEMPFPLVVLESIVICQMQVDIAQLLEQSSLPPGFPNTTNYTIPEWIELIKYFWKPEQGLTIEVFPKT